MVWLSGRLHVLNRLYYVWMITPLDRKFFLSRYHQSFLNITGLGEDVLAELPLVLWHRFPDKKSSLRPCYCSRHWHWKAPVPHIRQNTYTTPSTVKAGCCTETNLNTMPTCVSSRRNDVHCDDRRPYTIQGYVSNKNLVRYGTGFVHCLCRGNGPYAHPLPILERIAYVLYCVRLIMPCSDGFP
jgi:hypothetical protein